MTFRIYLADLSAYTKGELIGKWVDLPCADLSAELESVVGENNEFFIPDYVNNWGIHVDKYDNVDALNNLAQQLQDIESEGDGDWLRAFAEACANDVEYALKHFRDGSYFYPEASLEEVAESFVALGYNIPKGLECYIDYKAYARDLVYDGFVETRWGVIEVL